MDVNKICRCCLAEGPHKDLNSTYYYLEQMEIYSEMLVECFSIVLLPLSSQTNTICESCIETLRSSIKFKQQVLNVQEDLLSRAKHNLESDLRTDVKLELEDESEVDSDDYFLADAVTEFHSTPEVEDLKEESPEIVIKKKSSESKKKKGKNEDSIEEEQWKKHRIKKLIKRIATSIHDDPPKRLKSSRKLALSKDKLTYSKATEKKKHKENLLNTLKYSNATPFKSKSLLGFICAYCNIAFPEPANLRTHTEVDHKSDRLSLVEKIDLSDYVIKLDVSDLTCTLCDEQLTNLAAFREHLGKVHDRHLHGDVKDHLMQYKLKVGDVFDCAMCSSTYETFKMLTQHMNIHYSNFACTKCEAAFATKRSLTAHRSTHQNSNIQCEQCDKTFATTSKKNYHIKMKHSGERNISNCPYCDQPFRSYYQRNQHLIKVHNTESQYKCNICNRGFLLKSLLMYHVKKNHLMERNAQCNECGYSFFSKKALKAHMVKHTGERNYSCEVCHKAYARKYTLKEHMRIHNNDRRFKCDICAVSFVQKCSLKSHLLSNHGVNLTASEICCN